MAKRYSISSTVDKPFHDVVMAFYKGQSKTVSQDIRAFLERKTGVKSNVKMGRPKSISGKNK